MQHVPEHARGSQAQDVRAGETRRCRPPRRDFTSRSTSADPSRDWSVHCRDGCFGARGHLDRDRHVRRLFGSVVVAGLSRAWQETLTTYEILASKSKIAAETFSEAQVGDVVTLVEGDFLAHVHQLEGISFCFLDAEKEVYGLCYEEVVPRMVPGGLLVADNAINHQLTLQPMIDAALSDPRVDSLVVPIGKGELVCERDSFCSIAAIRPSSDFWAA